MNLCCSGIQAVPLPILNHNDNHNDRNGATSYVFKYSPEFLQVGTLQTIIGFSIGNVQ